MPRFRACFRFTVLSALLLGHAGAQTDSIEVDAASAGDHLKNVWSWHGYDEANYTTTAP
jgi:hypothetical protein